MKTCVGVYVYVHHSIPRHWLEASCQLQAPAALPQRTEPSVSIAEETGWTAEPVWTLWTKDKPLALAGTKTRPSRM
jgi:hypothetical protein